jgi:hypothetical protein
MAALLSFRGQELDAGGRNPELPTLSRAGTIYLELYPALSLICVKAHRHRCAPPNRRARQIACGPPLAFRHGPDF